MNNSLKNLGLFLLVVIECIALLYLLAFPVGAIIGIILYLTGQSFPESTEVFEKISLAISLFLALGISIMTYGKLKSYFKLA